MRSLIILPIALATGGCLHLSAKPMAFRCGSLLTDNVQTYQSTPLLAELQRDAGQDDGPLTASAAENMPLGAEAADIDVENDPVVKALARPTRAAPNSRSSGPPATLMLSGGGSWGAFGAGFLQAHGRSDWQVVTGVSTGSLQGLFVAAGDYDRMASEYAISKQEELARTNGILAMLAKGSEYDLAPLRGKLLDYLLRTDGAELPFVRMARPDAPQLFVGMVEARTGDLKVVSLTDMIRSVYRGAAKPTDEEVARLADCVAGVALASSSIPVRLTSVQIDGRTYMDGGVRSSVFDAGIAKRSALVGARGVRPEIYVLRNGPTVVFRDSENEDRIPKVDARPDLLRVGLRGYSTIVNQSELMSIASLRLNYPRGTIRVMTADGFNSPMNPKPCGPRPEAVFEPRFMACLIRWGSFKAKPVPRWIELSPIEIRR